MIVPLLIVIGAHMHDYRLNPPISWRCLVLCVLTRRAKYRFGPRKYYVIM